MLQSLTQLDGNILIGIQNIFVNNFFTPFVIFITRRGDIGFIWIALSIIMLIPKKTRKAGVLSLIALACTFLVCNVVLKNLIARTRPYEVIEGVRLLIEKQSDYSFPSGHTSASFTSAVVLCRTLPRAYEIGRASCRERVYVLV